MNPTPHTNNDLSSLSNELHDLIDAHVTTLTQEHVASFDPSHPHSSLLQFLHTQFSEHLEQQLHSLRLYTTHQHQQILIHQFVGNSPPQHPNTTNPNPNSDPDPNPHPNPNSNHRQTSSTTRRRRYLCYAVRKGRVRGIFYSWDECRLHVEGVSNQFKGFYTEHEAQAYLDLPHCSSVPE